MGALLFSHIRVSNANEKKKKNRYCSLNVREPLKINNSPEEPFITVCPGVAQEYLKVVAAWMWSPTDGSLSYLCLGTTSLLTNRTETFKSKIFET